MKQEIGIVVTSCWQVLSVVGVMSWMEHRTALCLRLAQETLQGILWLGVWQSRRNRLQGSAWSEAWQNIPAIIQFGEDVARSGDTGAPRRLDESIASLSGQGRLLFGSNQVMLQVAGDLAIYYDSEQRVFQFYLSCKGQVRVPKRINFVEKSKLPLTPPPHFWKIMLQFFSKTSEKSPI